MIISIASVLLLFVVVIAVEPSMLMRFVLIVPALAIAVGLPLAIRPHHFGAGKQVSVLSGRLSTTTVFYLLLTAIIVGFAAANLLRALYLQWSFSIDGLSYLQISRQYAAGEFVVRGYWAPLISWLAALPVSLGASPEISARVIITAAGAAGTLAAVALAARIGVRRSGQLMVALFSALLFTYITDISADVLSTTIMLAYFWLLLDQRIIRHPMRLGVLAGGLAALAYFARAYNFIYIVVHLVAYLGWMWWTTRRGQPLLKFAPLALVTLLLLVAPWVTLLSDRYDRLTFSTSALHTRGLIAPGARDWIICINGTMLCPEPQDVLFPWEDHLPDYQPNYNWSPLDSADHLLHQIVQIIRNTRYFINLNIGWAALGLLATGATLIHWRQRAFRDRMLYLLISATIYVGGYMLTFASSGVRFYLVPYALFVIAFVYALEHLLESSRRPLLRQLLAAGSACVLLLSFADPVHNLSSDVQAAARGDQALNACEPRDSAALAPYLDPPFVLIEEGTRVRSMLRIAYYAQRRNLGYLDPTRFTSEDLDSELRASGAKTVLVRETATASIPFLSGSDYTQVAQAEYCGDIYRIFALP